MSLITCKVLVTVWWAQPCPLSFSWQQEKTFGYDQKEKVELIVCKVMANSTYLLIFLKII